MISKKLLTPGSLVCLCILSLVCLSCNKLQVLLHPESSRTVRLLVTDTLSQPVREAVMVLYRTQSGVDTQLLSAPTDAQGIICYYDLEPGNYKVKYHLSPLGFPNDSLFVTVTAAAYQEWDWSLDFIPVPATKGHFSVTVKDSAGTALPGQRLLVYGPDSNQLLSALRSDVHGRIRYYNLQPGVYKIVNTLRSDSLNLTVTAGQTIQTALTISQSVVVLNKGGWSVIAYSSQENATTYAAAKLIDNQPATFWNSSWSIVPRPTHPHSVTIDMGSAKSIRGFVLQNAPFSSGGWPFRQFEMSVSTDLLIWQTVGTFEQPPREQDIEQFHMLDNPVTCRYFRFHTSTQWHTNPGTTVTLAEIGAFQ